ncbi:MAG: hypothetical protein KatS3mg078_1783 [Deltaproteobacteria bacterium]|nr:MAG: hypothetical protein KatS3mg078_1783 [Deltaproteobacteria bacterium]
MGREILRVVEEKLLTYRDQITFEEACKLAFLEEECFPQPSLSFQQGPKGISG